MNKKSFTPRIVFVISIIIVAACMRLLPHWPNFTPIAAIALFGGTKLNKKWLAFLVPLAAMFISDLIIGFHHYIVAVYLCFALTVSVGIYISKNAKIPKTIFASLLSSVLFYLITNFAVWLGSPFYSQDFNGLMLCYTAGLPFMSNGSLGISFFLNGLLGDLFYNTIFFGAFYLASLRFPVLAKA
jgi:hypothetical protein